MTDRLRQQLAEAAVRLVAQVPEVFAFVSPACAARTTWPMVRALL
jgi:hypothetical protein